MNYEFDMEVNKLRKNDRIFYNNEWRTVTESRQYLGPPGDDGTYKDTPKWVIRVAIPDYRWDYETYPVYGKQESDSYDSPDPYWPFDCTEEISFQSWDDVVRMFSNEIETLDEGLQPIRWWVGVFEVDRGFGGPEEGGWWYDIGEVRQVVAAKSYDQAQELADQLRRLWQSEGNSSSVVYRGGDYRVSVHYKYPEDYPSHVPHYS